MRLDRLLALALLLLVSRVALASDFDAAQIAAVDAAVDAERERQDVVGVAIGVVVDGEVAYTQGYGYADRDKKIEVSPTDTLFRWASISKPVTAITALQLAAAGKLDLDADIRTLVPEFPDHGHVITTRQLLCHQGGIVHYSNGKVVGTTREYDIENPYQNVIYALDDFKASPLVAVPGESYNYTTRGYILLSAVVQRAGEADFADQARERIFEPLGMTTMQPDYQWEDIPGRAVGYRRTARLVTRSTNTDVSWKLGGGGFISSVTDLAIFAAGLIDDDLLDDETKAMMFTRQKVANGRETTYGLGIGVQHDDEGNLVVVHSGSQEKTRTLMVVNVDERSAIVAMTNSQYANVGQFVEAVRVALEGE